MHDCPRGFADPGGVFDALATELADKDVLHFEAHRRGVPVAWQVDEAGDEVGELIGAQEQQRAPARAQVDDGHRHVQQLARAEREELRPGNGLDDVEQQLRRMARIALRQCDRFADPPRDQRDIHHIGVHGGHREQAHEAVLDRLMSGVFADHDDVGVGAVAQEAGNRGLREHQQVVAVGELREDLVPESQDAESARRIDRRLPALHRATLIAEQDEMPVGEPSQQRGDVGAISAREASLRVGVEFVGEAEQCSCQCSGIERNLAGIGEHA